MSCISRMRKVNVAWRWLVVWAAGKGALARPVMSRRVLLPFRTAAVGYGAISILA